MIKIHLLWATIRPQQFKEMHSEWIKRSDNPQNIQTYVAVNWQQHATELKDYLKSNFLITLNTNKIGVCYPSYQLSSNLGIRMGKCEDNDIDCIEVNEWIKNNIGEGEVSVREWLDEVRKYWIDFIRPRLRG